MNRKVVFGLTALGICISITVLGPLLVPYSPEAVSGGPLQSPTLSHLMGTDHLGRDVLSRIFAGGGGLITIAFAGTFLGVLLGVIIGLVTGYLGGLLDEILMRIVDLLLSIPILLTGLLIVTALGTDRIWLILGVGFIFTPRTARIIRAAALSEKSKEYVEAAKTLGSSKWRVVLLHILPNIENLVVVEVTTRFAQSLLLVSALSFLGLGTPMGSPDWGRMLSEGRDYLLVAPWMVVFPAVAISSLVIAVNLFADGLQETSTRRLRWVKKPKTSSPSLSRWNTNLGEQE